MEKYITSEVSEDKLAEMMESESHYIIGMEFKDDGRTEIVIRARVKKASVDQIFGGVDLIINEVSKFATLAFMESDGKYHG